MKQLFKPAISVGIPAYNEEENIQLLLRSLVKQKQVNFSLREIIVISDGSTDRTVDEAKQVKDRRIKIIEGENRLGENRRLNEIVRLVSASSEGLLLIEADTLITSFSFMQWLVDLIPADRKYGYISAKSQMYPTRNLFGRIMNFGFSLRMEIFRQAAEKNNLYLVSSSRLISKEQLSKTHWSNQYHEDSYFYRETKKGNLPILMSNKAVAYFKSPENLRDYLLQSSKFQKAKEKENLVSTVYVPKLKLSKVWGSCIRMFRKKPYYFLAYFGLVLVARIYSRFTDNYSVFWQQYLSTKSFAFHKRSGSSVIQKAFEKNAQNYKRVFSESLGTRYLSDFETGVILENVCEKKKPFLDLGIGIGRNAKILLEKGNKVVGLDFSLPMLSISKKNLDKFYRKSMLQLLRHDLNKPLPFKNSSFSGAVCIRVIKYVDNWRLLLREVYRVLGQQGIFIVEIPNKSSVQSFSALYNIYQTIDRNIFEKELKEIGFVIKKKIYGTKIPLYFYRKSTNGFLLNVILNCEKLLKKIIGDSFCRNILYVVAKSNK